MTRSRVSTELEQYENKREWELWERLGTRMAQADEAEKRDDWRWAAMRREQATRRWAALVRFRATRYTPSSYLG